MNAAEKSSFPLALPGIRQTVLGVATARRHGFGRRASRDKDSCLTPDFPLRYNPRLPAVTPAGVELYDTLFQVPFSGSRLAFDALLPASQPVLNAA